MARLGEGRRTDGSEVSSGLLVGVVATFLLAFATFDNADAADSDLSEADTACLGCHSIQGLEKETAERRNALAAHFRRSICRIGSPRIRVFRLPWIHRPPGPSGSRERHQEFAPILHGRGPKAAACATTRRSRSTRAVCTQRASVKVIRLPRCARVATARIRSAPGRRIRLVCAAIPLHSGARQLAAQCPDFISRWCRAPPAMRPRRRGCWT